MEERYPMEATTMSINTDETLEIYDVKGPNVKVQISLRLSPLGEDHASLL